MHEAIPSFTELAKTITPGLYRHYKGGEYRVVRLARLEWDPAEEMVVYESTATYDVWVRPVREFVEQVSSEEYKGPRFIRIE